MTFQRDLAWHQLELTYRASIAHQFARYALALNFELLPEPVVHQAKRCLLDALGCAIGAYEAPGRTICEDTVNDIGGREEATVFCSGLRTSALNAALVNSFLIRFLDYNDSGGGGHNSDALASILAVAEREKVSGKELLTSVVISYELGARFRDSVTLTSPVDARLKPPFSLVKKGWTPDIRAGLNQPPALGKLMALTEEQIANAIGICMSHTLPLNILDSDKEENVMAKNIRFGWAAHDAILACMLAKRGFTGPVRIVECESGIRTVIAQGEMDLERLVDFSGWRILDVRFKGMPANSTTHGHVFATIGLVNEHDLKPEDIAAVHITASMHEAHHTTTPSKKYPRNAESADHSAFYSNALAIKERAFGPDSIKPEKFIDPVVLDLIEKITVTGDPSLGHNQGASEIITKDGRCFRKRMDVIHGSRKQPFTDRELEDKFREMACQRMGDEQIRKIFDACWNLEAVADLQKFAKLMVLPEFAVSAGRA
jgi:2-methylcitrate dehydratase